MNVLYQCFVYGYYVFALLHCTSVLYKCYVFLLHYWASEASPTLGCSIEISRDICIYVGMSRMSNLHRRNYVDQTRACSKSFFLAVKPVTPVLFISYTLEL